MLDIDALATGWQCKLGGRVHTARPVSVHQVRAYGEACEAAETLPDRRFAARIQDAALFRLFRRAFPWRWRYLVDRRADPLWHLVRLPGPVLQEVIQDFFVYLGILGRPEIPKRTASSSSAPPVPATGETPSPGTS